jgi:hypothetical protein
MKRYAINIGGETLLAADAWYPLAGPEGQLAGIRWIHIEHNPDGSVQSHSIHTYFGTGFYVEDCLPEETIDQFVGQINAWNASQQPVIAKHVEGYH